MRRWGLTLTALVLLTGGLFPHLARAQDAPPAHIDPVTITGSTVDTIALFAFIEAVLTNIKVGLDDDSRQLLEGLGYTNIPPDFRFLNERGELLSSLGAVFQEAGRWLAEASLLLEEGRRSEAREVLQEVSPTLEQSAALLNEIRLGMEILETRFGITRLSTDNPIRQAFDEVEVAISGLETLSEELTVTATELEKLAETPLGTPVELPQLPGQESRHYTVSLTLDTDLRAYPGRPIIVDGQVTSDNGPAPTRSLFRVLLDTEVLAEFVDASEFQQQITLPPETLEGQHALTLEFPVQGLYARARFTRPLEVAFATINLTVRSPAFSLDPRSMGVSGTATSQFGPLKDATVTLRMGDARPTVLHTDDQGAFSGPVALPFVRLLLPGFQRLTVRVDAFEPWHRDLHEETSLFVFNMTNVIFMALVLAYLGAATARLLARARRVRGKEIGEPSAVPGFTGGLPSEDARGALVPRQASATRARIAEAYLTAARFLGTTRGVFLLPSVTLRDFLTAIGIHVGSAFTELTGLTERAVYGSGEPADADVSHAEDLARAVQREGG